MPMLDPHEPPYLAVDRAAAGDVDLEFAELQRLIIQLMDVLAERVLDQIQTTRTMADQIAAQKSRLEAVLPSDGESLRAEAHLQRLSWRLKDVMRRMPAYHWDNYVDTCMQIARMVQRAEEQIAEAADGAAAVQPDPGEREI
jgi:hypothetical protein